MRARDVLAAIGVATVWGLTFIAIKVGVGEVPPLLLSALRFAFAAFPGVLFVRPPKASPWLVCLYGALIGVGQFGLLFLAIRRGFPVGLASLIVQLQAFFTIFLAWALLREEPRRTQVIGAAVAFAGIALIGSQRLDGASFWPFAMVIVAAAFWGAGNVVAKLARRADMFAFVIWSSLAPPVPLLLLSLVMEGHEGVASLIHPSLKLVVAVLVVSYAGTVLGFGVWARLMSLYPAAAVAPFALLVPVVGMTAGSAVFGEPLGTFEIWGAVLVLAGLCFNVFGDALLRRRLGQIR
ncbi:MAG TPA: EamA family transporter [Roseiarcus sp.]|jgi:O-acetylserine/cysteine efflux transporter